MTRFSEMFLARQMGGSLSRMCILEFRYQDFICIVAHRLVSFLLVRLLCPDAISKHGLRTNRPNSPNRCDIGARESAVYHLFGDWQQVAVQIALPIAGSIPARRVRMSAEVTARSSISGSVSVLHHIWIGSGTRCCFSKVLKMSGGSLGEH